MRDMIFTFYPSYYAYAKDLQAKERLAFYDAMLRYFFDGEDCDERNPARKAFALVKPSITASLRMKSAKRKRDTSANTCANTCANTSANTCDNTCDNTLPKRSSIGTKEEGTKEQRNDGLPTPPTPAPSTVAAAALKSTAPTWEDVRTAAHSLSVPEDFARRFFDDMTRDNWAYVNRRGFTATVNRLCLASVLGGRWRANRRGGAADGQTGRSGNTNQPDGVVHHEEGYENPL